MIITKQQFNEDLDLLSDAIHFYADLYDLDSRVWRPEDVEAAWERIKTFAQNNFPVGV